MISEKKEAQSGKAVLYSYWRSSCSFRVRIALSLKGIEYEYKTVNLLNKEQEEGGFRKEKNAMKQVPVLQIDGLDLVQSVAIVEYLDETRGDTCPLLPSNAADRAKARALVEIINSGIQPIQNMAIRNRITELGGDKMEWGQNCIKNGFDALERELSRIPCGKYCLGETLSIVDVFLVPQVFNAIQKFNLDMGAYPLISKVYGNLSKLEAVKRAHPDAQPDAIVES